MLWLYIAAGLLVLGIAAAGLYALVAAFMDEMEGR